MKRFLIILVIFTILPLNITPKIHAEKRVNYKKDFVSNDYKTLKKEVKKGNKKAKEQENNLYIINFKDQIDYKLLKKLNAKIMKEYNVVNAVLVEVNEKELKKIKTNSEIQSIEKNSNFKIQSDTIIPESETNIKQFTNTNVTSVWGNENKLTGKGVNIAVFDTGFGQVVDGKIVHNGQLTDGQVQVTSGYQQDVYVNSESVNCTDFATCEKGNYEDNSDNSHGTAVASIIGAKHNGYGVQGIAPDANIYAVKMNNGDITTDIFLSSLEWLSNWNDTHEDSEDINIVNMSLQIQDKNFGGTVIAGFLTTTINEYIHQLYTNYNILFVGSAGNYGTETVGENVETLPNGTTINWGSDIVYPAINKDVIAVAAATEDGKSRRTDSDTGPDVEITAPGTNFTIASTTNKKYSDDTTNNMGYGYGFGQTSSAAPVVTGVLALMLEQDREMGINVTNEILRKQMQEEALPLYGETSNDTGYTFHKTYNRNWEYGYGLIQIKDFVQESSDTFQLRNTNVKLYDLPFDFAPSKDVTFEPNHVIQTTKKYKYSKLVNGYEWYYFDPNNDGNGKWINESDLIIPDRENKTTGIYFNGNDQYGTAQVNISPEVMPTVTMEAWVKPERANYWNRQEIVSQDDGGYDRAITIEPYSNKFGIFTGSGVWTPTTVDEDEWQHIAVVYTDSSIYFYKNGERYVYDGVPTNWTGFSFITIGKNYKYGNNFIGNISDVRIWNKELTSDELGNETTIPEDNLIAQWNLDEMFGNIGHDSLQKNNLTFFNNPIWEKQKPYNQSEYSILYDTEKADILVKVGDTDNVGFGFEDRYDPYSEMMTTSTHHYPFEPSSKDSTGTDRIMRPSSFDYNSTNGEYRDGYTNTTQGKDQPVAAVPIHYDLKEKTIHQAELQLYIDDLQTSYTKSIYHLYINNTLISEADSYLNSLDETGPKGELVSIPLSQEHLSLLQDGNIQVKLDDSETGIGDAYALDFVQLLINPKNTEMINAKTDAPDYGIILNGYNQHGQANVNIDTNVMPEMTFEAWIKPNASSHDQTIMASDNGNYDRNLGIQGGINIFRIATGSGFWTPTQAEIGQWQHVALIYTSDHKIIFYKNGKRYDYAGTTSFFDSYPYINIGRNPYGGGIDYFNGTIANAHIWNKELTSTELNRSLTGGESGLVASWALNENLGEYGTDLLNQHDVEFFNNPDWVNNRETINPSTQAPNYGIVLNGNYQYGQAEVNIDPTVMKDVTIEAWIKPSSSFYWQNIISSDNGGYDRTISIEPNTNNLTVSVGNGAWTVTPATVGEWQHIAVVYKQDGEVEFYKNGKRYVYSGRAINGPSFPFINIGRNPAYGGIDYYDGVMADVRIWNRPLESTELNKTLTENETGLVAHWNLNESSGDTGINSVDNSKNITFYNEPRCFIGF